MINRINILLVSVGSVLVLNACTLNGAETLDLDDVANIEEQNPEAHMVVEDALSYESLSTGNVEIYDLNSGHAYVPELFNKPQPPAQDEGLIKENFDSGSVTVYSLDQSHEFHPVPRYDVTPENVSRDLQETAPPLLPMAGGDDPFESPFTDDGLMKPGAARPLFRPK